ncbi:hypothetical protein [Rhizomicrobium electricum]|jgi:hypothetical protein|uniref:Uncharacterized protein n=1 Tax=Rhizomicrobium electricum TaxID=480070 RepID=A0ABP3PR43_9PROT|nr:hypothetical protein [Rhizomicrobium electricum]NIJ49065.1 hypothetical protein [Rhizomicrobium electricum]
MQTRRGFVASAAAVGAIAACGAAARAEEAPSARFVKGTPSILDYGGGVKVPCTKEAFFTLWEGETFWLTFGFGISSAQETANKLAAKQATGLMKFMLLTLAFAPERLVKRDGGGWCKKDPAARDFVLGELDLPVQSSKSMTDVFLGSGNTVISPFWNFGGNITGTNLAGPRSDAPVASSPGAPSDLRQANLHAFSTCLVMKKDLSLEAVRQRAVIIQL